MTDHVAHENRKQNASYVKGHQAMNDDVKKVVAWLRRTAGGFPHLETLLAHIDGEPARLAAAREAAVMEWRAGAADRDELRADCERQIAAAREEQREACADWLEDTVLPEAAYSVVREVRATPLTATPLADEIAALRARVAELAESLRLANENVVRLAKAYAETAEERDALKSRLYGPLTAEEYARLTALESLTETEARQAMASGVSADKLGTFLGRVYKTVGERDALRAERDARYDCKGGPGTTAPECGGCATCLHRVIVGVEAERDALRAQLLSERERLERWLTAPDGKQYERGTVQAVFDECDALRAQQVDLLDAMDKSKP